MSRKGIILSLVIFIALGLYVFLVEKKKPLSEGKEVILKFDQNKIQRLVLGHDGKEIVLNKEKDGKWQMTSPLLTKADDEVIKGLVDDLSNLEASQGLEVDPAQWGDFGLKKPGIEVAVAVEGRGEEKVSFGDKNPAGTSIYTRLRGKDRVFLVSTYLASSFKKEVFDLREKKLLSFEKEKVTGIELIHGAEDIVLEKRGEEWQVTKPVKDKGDKYEIENFLSKLYDLKAAGFIDELKEGGSYGLDKPEVKCIILAGAEKIGQTLICGKSFQEEGKDLQYAQREFLATIFKIETSKAGELKKNLFDLRNKVILSLDRDKIDKIALVYPEKSLALERDKEKKWFAAGKERIELDSDKVNDLLWEITELKAVGIAAEEVKDPASYGLDKPEVKVIIKAEGKEKVILLGQKTARPDQPLGTASPEGLIPKESGEDAIYASLAGDPRLFLVEASLSSRLKKDLPELKKAAPPAPAEESGEKKGQNKSVFPKGKQKIKK